MFSKVLIFSSLIIVIGAGWIGYQKYSHPTLESTKPPLYTGPVEKIRVGNLGEYSVFNIIAKDRGFFKENGLDAVVQEYPSGVPAINDLLAGKQDVAVAADFVGVRALFTNPELKIVTEVSKQQVFQLIVRKDKGVSSPIDLKGKRIGVTKKGAGEFYLGRFLTLNKLRYSEVVVVDLLPADLKSQLENGQIDAAVVFEPTVYNLQKKLGDAVVSWPVQGSDNTIALAYTTSTFIQNHPQAVDRYLGALIEADQYLKDHPTEAKAIVAKNLHYDLTYVNYVWPKFRFGVKLDQELLLTMEDQASWIIENKLTDKTSVPNFLNSIDFQPLMKLKPEVNSIVH